jgi:predicted RNA methylase
VEAHELGQLHGVVAHAIGGCGDQHILRGFAIVVAQTVEATDLDPRSLELLKRGVKAFDTDDMMWN